MQVTKEQKEKFLLAAEIIKKGLRWELANTFDRLPGEEIKWKEGGDLIQLMQVILDSRFSIREYEASFPELPAGHEWHNPYNILAVELSEKYRLLTKAEARNINNNTPGVVMITAPIKGTPTTFYVMHRDTPIVLCSPIYPYKPAA